jgi:hypothetical protein
MYGFWVRLNLVTQNRIMSRECLPSLTVLTHQIKISFSISYILVDNRTRPWIKHSVPFTLQKSGFSFRVDNNVGQLSSLHTRNCLHCLFKLGNFHLFHNLVLEKTNPVSVNYHLTGILSIVLLELLKCLIHRLLNLFSNLSGLFNHPAKIRAVLGVNGCTNAH